jgi:glycerol-3-phosphate dehydrogenase
MTGDERTVHARALVNAGGPWVADILHNLIHVEARAGIRLVRGSHLVTRKLFDHDRAYFLQGTDGRIVFAIPYENDFTLLGTTDVDHPDPETPPVCTDAERDYLLRFVTDYFRTPVTSADIVHSFAGIRPLYDDGASSATEATRDYVLKLDTDGPPLLSVFGGKITTYRKLAEEVLDRLLPALGRNNRHWTGGTPLPGGDFAVGGVASLVAALRAQFPKLEQVQAERLVRAYGTDAAKMLGQTTDGGRDFGAGLTEREVDWMIAHEFAQTADDVVWRRSKLGLRLSAEQIAEIDAYMAARAPGNSRRNP